jgi:hypothetical protein
MIGKIGTKWILPKGEQPVAQYVSAGKKDAKISNSHEVTQANSP